MVDMHVDVYLARNFGSIASFEPSESVQVPSTDSEAMFQEKEMPCPFQADL